MISVSFTSLELQVSFKHWSIWQQPRYWENRVSSHLVKLLEKNLGNRLIYSRDFNVLSVWLFLVLRMVAITKWRNTKDETTLTNTHTTAQKHTNNSFPSSKKHPSILGDGYYPRLHLSVNTRQERHVLIRVPHMTCFASKHLKFDSR